MEEPSEPQVKAAFLLNFPKYIDWPPASLPSTNSQYVVAFWGESQVAEHFRTMAAGRTVNGRPIEFRLLRNEEDFASGGVHIIFFSGTEHRRSATLLSRIANQGVLTVGEEPDFLQKGGVINLARKDLRIRLQVSLAAAKKAELKISSKLLGVADVVDPKK